MSIIGSFCTILPPETFQRRNYIIEITINLVLPFLLILIVKAMP